MEFLESSHEFYSLSLTEHECWPNHDSTATIVLNKDSSMAHMVYKLLGILWGIGVDPHLSSNNSDFLNSIGAALDGIVV